MILGLIIPIVGSIFPFVMVAMVSYGSHYQNGHKISTVEARALILGLIIPIVGSIFPFVMVAMVSYGSHYQKIEIWPQNLNC